jgi:syntaxin 1B/2/3
MQDFLSRVSHLKSEIQGLNADVQQIAMLRQRAITSSGSNTDLALEELKAQIQSRNASIREQLSSLKHDVEQSTDGSRDKKKSQYETVSSTFKRELQGYMAEEQRYEQRYREQIARQYRIVNPNATDAEVQQATQTDWGNDGVFQTAVSFTSHLVYLRSSFIRTNMLTSIVVANTSPRPSIFSARIRSRTTQRACQDRADHN